MVAALASDGLAYPLKAVRLGIDTHQQLVLPCT